MIQNFEKKKLKYEQRETASNGPTDVWDLTKTERFFFQRVEIDITHIDIKDVNWAL